MQKKCFFCGSKKTIRPDLRKDMKRLQNDAGVIEEYYDSGKLKKRVGNGVIEEYYENGNPKKKVGNGKVEEWNENGTRKR